MSNTNSNESDDHYYGAGNDGILPFELSDTEGEQPPNAIFVKNKATGDDSDRCLLRNNTDTTAGSTENGDELNDLEAGHPEDSDTEGSKKRASTANGKEPEAKKRAKANEDDSNASLKDAFDTFIEKCGAPVENVLGVSSVAVALAGETNPVFGSLGAVIGLCNFAYNSAECKKIEASIGESKATLLQALETTKSDLELKMTEQKKQLELKMTEQKKQLEGVDNDTKKKLDDLKKELDGVSEQLATITTEQDKAKVRQETIIAGLAASKARDEEAKVRQETIIAGLAEAKARDEQMKEMLSQLFNQISANNK